MHRHLRRPPKARSKHRPPPPPSHPAMVVLTNPTLEHIPVVTVHKPHGYYNSGHIPVVDMSRRNEQSTAALVRACEDLGFFKVVNHGVPLELMARLEAEAVGFFKGPQADKDREGPANPFGYGSRRIGPNGDVGWVEYLLMPVTNSHAPLTSRRLRSAMEYIKAVKNLAMEILEMLADGLNLHSRDVFSRMVRDEESDSVFRINHYPPRPTKIDDNSDITGFGEHTDPQIISLLRSNHSSGLEISLKDGSWFPVTPDPTSFFINVGDSLQVLTNGRFRSVKHRVIANSIRSRVSMIFFGGPPSGEKMSPFPDLMKEGEESHYREFTWSEFKSFFYKSKLADNRLAMFEK